MEGDQLRAGARQDDEYLYIFGIHGGRYGGVALARSAQTCSFVRLHLLVGHDGSGTRSRYRNRPAPVELSNRAERVRQPLDLPARTEHGIVMLRAGTDGTWSDDTMVISSDEIPALYGSYLHPWASSGEEIYFNMSQWVPYNIRLMRARRPQRITFTLKNLRRN